MFCKMQPPECGVAIYTLTYIDTFVAPTQIDIVCWI